MSEQQKLTPEQETAWIREHFQKAGKYLAEKGLLLEVINHEDSRCLPPLVAIWKVKLASGERCWVINGDLPSDHVELSVASNARDAMKHFALTWQLRAERILASDQDNAQKQFARILIGRAEGLYQLAEQDALWQTPAG